MAKSRKKREQERRLQAKKMRKCQRRDRLLRLKHDLYQLRQRCDIALELDHDDYKHKAELELLSEKIDEARAEVDAGRMPNLQFLQPEWLENNIPKQEGSEDDECSGSNITDSEQGTGHAGGVGAAVGRWCRSVVARLGPKGSD